MPFDEHAARQIDPDRCDTFRRENGKFGPGVDVIWCKRGGKMDVQSIRFDKSKFTADEARDWLKKHGFSAEGFEPARPMSAAAGVAAQMMDVADCPMGEDCPLKKKGMGAAGCPDLAATYPSELRCSYGSGGGLELAAEAGATGPARVRMTAYTGVPMKLDGFAYPVVVDLESIRAGRGSLPILRAHNPDRVAGHTTRVEAGAQRLHAEGVLSGLPAHTDEVVLTAARGFPWQVSLGANMGGRPELVEDGKTAKVNGRNWKGPLLVARGAALRELSLLPMGADGDTSAAFGWTPELLLVEGGGEPQRG